MRPMHSRLQWCALAGFAIVGLLAGRARGQSSQTPQTAPRLSDPLAAPPERPTLQEAISPDKVVLRVGDKKFTKADMDRLIATLNPQSQHAIAAQGKKSLGDQYAVVVALSD